MLPRMRPRLRRLLLLAATTDREAVREAGGWRTRCLHCRSSLRLAADGDPLGHATLEHVVPRSWFERPAAAPLVARVGSADDARNLALACRRCNHDKGKGPDERGPGDARAFEVVTALLERRLARWRAPADAPAP
jgi:5-methylcytosine-specific restriction endonuclease McrA